MISDPIDRPYPFTKVAYPAGSGTGYEFTQLKVNSANKRNFSKELKVQYTQTRKQLFATIGLTFQMITGYEDFPSHSTDNVNYQNNRSANVQLGVYFKF